MSVERNYFDNIQKLEQEIKQLKENYEKLGKSEAKSWLELNEKYILKLKENKQLKERLDAMIKHKIRFEHAFSEANHEAHNLKQKLEKIKHLAEIRYDTEIFEILNGDSTS